MVSAGVRANLFSGRNHSCECQEDACTPLCTSAFQQEPLPATGEHSLSLLPGRNIPRGDAGPILHGWLSTLSLRKTPLRMESPSHFRLWKQQIAQTHAAEQKCKDHPLVLTWKWHQNWRHTAGITILSHFTANVTIRVVTFVRIPVPPPLV